MFFQAGRSIGRGRIKYKGYSRSVILKINGKTSTMVKSGNAHLNSEGGSISTADLLVLTG